jgi:hypothetical protein
MLEDGLEQSQAGVLVWSSSAGDSDWVRREYQTLERQAHERKTFCFVPVRLDDARPPAFAANRVFLDFRSYPDGPNRGELLRLLHSITGQSLSHEAARFAAEQDAIAKEQADETRAVIRNKDREVMLELFNKGGLAWETSSALGCKAAEGLIKLGRNDDGIQLLAQLEARFPRAIRPRQLRALALARRNAGDLRRHNAFWVRSMRQGSATRRHLASMGVPGWIGTASPAIVQIWSSHATYTPTSFESRR